MAMTFQNLYEFIEDMLNDDSTATTTRIKLMVNAAYKKILSFLPNHWVEKTWDVAVAPDDDVVSIDAECVRVISVVRPTGQTGSVTPVIATKEDWEQFRRPNNAVDQPRIFFPAGHSGTGNTKQMQLYMYPACGTTWTGTWSVRGYSMPDDLSNDADMTVLDQRWDDLLLKECQVQALIWDGRHQDALALGNIIQPEWMKLTGEDKASEKK